MVLRKRISTYGVDFQLNPTTGQLNYNGTRYSIYDLAFNLTGDRIVAICNPIPESETHGRVFYSSDYGEHWTMKFEASSRFTAPICHSYNDMICTTVGNRVLQLYINGTTPEYVYPFSSTAQVEGKVLSIRGAFVMWKNDSGTRAGVYSCSGMGTSRVHSDEALSANGTYIGHIKSGYNFYTTSNSASLFISDTSGNLFKLDSNSSPWVLPTVSKLSFPDNLTIDKWAGNYNHDYDYNWGYIYGLHLADSLTDAHLYRFNADGAYTDITANLNLDSSNHDMIADIGCTPSSYHLSNGKVYVTVTHNYTTGELFVSEDDGVTWRSLYTYNVYAHIQLSSDPINKVRLVKDLIYIFHGTSTPLVSLDEGNTWTTAVNWNSAHQWNDETLYNITGLGSSNHLLGYGNGGIQGYDTYITRGLPTEETTEVVTKYLNKPAVQELVTQFKAYVQSKK